MPTTLRRPRARTPRRLALADVTAPPRRPSRPTTYPCGLTISHTLGRGHMPGPKFERPWPTVPHQILKTKGSTTKPAGPKPTPCSPSLTHTKPNRRGSWSRRVRAVQNRTRPVLQPEKPGTLHQSSTPCTPTHRRHTLPEGVSRPTSLRASP